MYKRRKKWLALAVACLWVLGPAAYAAEKYGVVARFTGTVTVRPAGAKEFKPLQSNSFLYVGDAVRTGEGSRLAIVTVDGAEVAIDEKSLVILDKVVQTGDDGVARRVRSMFMEFGRSWMKVLGRGQMNSTIRSHVGVCAVRGTEFTVAVTAPDGQTKKVTIRKKKSQRLLEELAKARLIYEEALEHYKQQKQRLALMKSQKWPASQRKEQVRATNQAEKEMKIAKREFKRAQKRARKGGKGAEWEEIVSMIANQRMSVSVLEGLVEVSNEFGKQNVAQGQVLQVAAGQAPEPAKKMDPSQIPSWQNSIGLSEEDKAKLFQELQKGDTEKILRLEIEEDGKKKELKLKFKKQ